MADQDRGVWIVALVLVLVLSPIIGRIVLGPVNRAGGRLRAPTKFLLMDFVWLLFQLQLALGFSVQYIGVEYLFSFSLLLGFLSFASVVMWAGAVSFLSRAGVRSSLRRGLFILVLLPATLTLMVGTPLLPIVAWVMQTDPRTIEIVLRLKGALPENAGIWLFAAALPVLPLIAFLLHRLSAWMVEELGDRPVPQSVAV